MEFSIQPISAETLKAFKDQSQEQMVCFVGVLNSCSSEFVKEAAKDVVLKTSNAGH